jgi:hypothetical protein
MRQIEGSPEESAGNVLCGVIIYIDSPETIFSSIIHRRKP